MPIAELARTLGHTTLDLTVRYTNSDETTPERARNIVDSFHAETTEAQATTTAPIQRLEIAGYAKRACSILPGQTLHILLYVDVNSKIKNSIIRHH
jgi:hypothetical protein